MVNSERDTRGSEVPGRPPGDSAGPPGPAARPYPLLIIFAIAAVLVAFVAIAVATGAFSR